MKNLVIFGIVKLSIVTILYICRCIRKVCE